MVLMAQCLLDCLQEVHLEKYQSNFIKNGITTCESLSQLTINDFVRCGVVSVNDRLQLFKLIQIVKSVQAQGYYCNHDHEHGHSKIRSSNNTLTVASKAHVHQAANNSKVVSRQLHNDARKPLKNQSPEESQRTKSFISRESPISHKTSSNIVTESPVFKCRKVLTFNDSEIQSDSDDESKKSNTNKKQSPVTQVAEKEIEVAKPSSTVETKITITSTKPQSSSNMTANTEIFQPTANVVTKEFAVYNSPRKSLSLQKKQVKNEPQNYINNNKNEFHAYFQPEESVPLVEKVYHNRGYNYGVPSIISNGSISSETTVINDCEKIRVCVRKRPLNSREVKLQELDVIDIPDTGSVIVHEAKVTVDLKNYIQQHIFQFDEVFSESCSNDDVYQTAVRPLVFYVFRGGMATCFAFGQTGAGKSHTLLGNKTVPGIFMLAGKDMFMFLGLDHSGRGMKLFISFYEIYCGHVFDLLERRRRVHVRDNSKHRACITGLSELRANNIGELSEIVKRGLAVRSVGCTGVNQSSSRSHAILQLEIKDCDGSRVGRLSFIDLAGSERASDAKDGDRQTRLEGAEINQSLLALKECIRCLDQESSHTPYRQSKLTHILRDSFVGNSRTVMIANISPSLSAFENTLNTLRYADRVKELRKNANIMDRPKESKTHSEKSDSLPKSTPALKQWDVSKAHKEESAPSLFHSSKVVSSTPKRKLQHTHDTEAKSIPIDVSAIIQDSPIKGHAIGKRVAGAFNRNEIISKTDNDEQLSHKNGPMRKEKLREDEVAKRNGEDIIQDGDRADCEQYEYDSWDSNDDRGAEVKIVPNTSKENPSANCDPFQKISNEQNQLLEPQISAPSEADSGSGRVQSGKRQVANSIHVKEFISESDRESVIHDEDRQSNESNVDHDMTSNEDELAVQHKAVMERLNSLLMRATLAVEKEKKLVSESADRKKKHLETVAIIPSNKVSPKNRSDIKTAEQIEATCRQSQTQSKCDDLIRNSEIVSENHSVASRTTADDPVLGPVLTYHKQTVAAAGEHDETSAEVTKAAHQIIPANMFLPADEGVNVENKLFNVTVLQKTNFPVLPVNNVVSYVNKKSTVLNSDKCQENEADLLFEEDTSAERHHQSWSEVLSSSMHNSDIKDGSSRSVETTKHHDVCLLREEDMHAEREPSTDSGFVSYANTFNRLPATADSNAYKQNGMKNNIIENIPKIQLINNYLTCDDNDSANKLKSSHSASVKTQLTNSPNACAEKCDKSQNSDPGRESPNSHKVQLAPSLSNKLVHLESDAPLQIRSGNVMLHKSSAFKAVKCERPHNDKIAESVNDNAYATSLPSAVEYNTTTITTAVKSKISPLKIEKLATFNPIQPFPLTSYRKSCITAPSIITKTVFVPAPDCSTNMHEGHVSNDCDVTADLRAAKTNKERENSSSSSTFSPGQFAVDRIFPISQNKQTKSSNILAHSNHVSLNSQTLSASSYSPHDNSFKKLQSAQNETNASSPSVLRGNQASVERSGPNNESSFDQNTTYETTLLKNVQNLLMMEHEEKLEEMTLLSKEEMKLLLAVRNGTLEFPAYLDTLQELLAVKAECVISLLTQISKFQDITYHHQSSSNNDVV